MLLKIHIKTSLRSLQTLQSPPICSIMLQKELLTFLYVPDIVNLNVCMCYGVLLYKQTLYSQIPNPHMN